MLFYQIQNLKGRAEYRALHSRCWKLFSIFSSSLVPVSPTHDRAILLLDWDALGTIKSQVNCFDLHFFFIYFGLSFFRSALLANGLEFYFKNWAKRLIILGIPWGTRKEVRTFKRFVSLLYALCSRRRQRASLKCRSQVRYFLIHVTQDKMHWKIYIGFSLCRTSILQYWTGGHSS